MRKFFDSTADRLFALLFALLFMQAPALFQQYLQRLAGSVEELKAIVGAMTGVARQHGKTVEQYIAKFLASSDPEISQQGSLMLGLTERLQRLGEALSSLESAKPLTKPFQFFAHLDFSLLKGTLSHFQPAMGLTVESALWGVAGLFFGLFVYAALKRGALLLRRAW